MKSLVVYYSHSGNTARLAYKLLNALREKGESADMFELRDIGGRRNPLLSFLYKIIPFKVDLGETVPLDIKDYDLLCIGMPVWGGRPASPVLAYLKRCKNTDGKKIICFQVYGIKGSARRCVDYVKKILDKKGHSAIIAMNIRWNKARDGEFVDKLIQETIGKLSLLL